MNIQDYRNTLPKQLYGTSEYPASAKAYLDLASQYRYFYKNQTLVPIYDATKFHQESKVDKLIQMREKILNNIE